MEELGESALTVQDTLGHQDLCEGNYKWHRFQAKKILHKNLAPRFQIQYKNREVVKWASINQGYNSIRGDFWTRHKWSRVVKCKARSRTIHFGTYIETVPTVQFRTYIETELTVQFGTYIETVKMHVTAVFHFHHYCVITLLNRVWTDRCWSTSITVVWWDGGTMWQLYADEKHSTIRQSCILTRNPLCEERSYLTSRYGKAFIECKRHQFLATVRYASSPLTHEIDMVT